MKFAGPLKSDAPDEQQSREDLVHDARVATRRLRAAFGLCSFRPASRRKEGQKRVATFGQVLGEVRDLDTSLCWLRERLDLVADEERSGVEALVLQKEQRRHSALARLRGRATLFFDGEVEEIATGLLLLRTGPGRLGGGEARRRLRKQVERARDWLCWALEEEGKADFVHHLRTRAKKLRYHAELLLGIVPRADKIAEAVAPLQDGLGELHDCDARMHWLTEAIVTAKPDELPGMVRLLRDAQEERRWRWAKMQPELLRWREKKHFERMSKEI
jgi:CHAD domain-containing protein